MQKIANIIIENTRRDIQTYISDKLTNLNYSLEEVERNSLLDDYSNSSNNYPQLLKCKEDFLNRLQRILAELEE